MSHLHLPNFSNFNLGSFENELASMLDHHLKEIENLLHNKEHYSWQNLIEPLEDLEDELEKFWSPFSHLNSVMNSAEIRACYQACLPKLSAYQSAIGQNRKLYEAIQSLDISFLDDVQKKWLRICY